MEYNEHFELVLNHITDREFRFMNEKRFEDYIHTAALWLNHQGIHLFEDEIMVRYTNSAKKNFKEILESKKFEYLPGMMVQRGDKREQVYYDICGGDIVPADDPFFPFFFACKFSQTDILEMDEFLNYHLQRSFEGDTVKYFRFLTIVFRRYEHLITKNGTLETAKEWIQSVEKAPEFLGKEESEISKSMMQRVAGDKKTVLTVVQTAMLIEFLQKAGIILNNKNLTYTHAGKAFHLLTWYSSNSIRLQLGKNENIKNEDYEELHEAILKLAKLIEPHISKNKRS